MEHKIKKLPSKEKYKSWYKVDIDGPYITKYEPQIITAINLNNINHSKNMRKLKKTVISNVCQPPPHLIYPHTVTANLAGKCFMLFFFIIILYCGYALLFPMKGKRNIH